VKKRTSKLFVEDMLTAMEKVERYTKELNYDSFVANEMAVDAAMRNLLVIGEAAKNIPEEIRAKYSDIPWKRMIGLRNITIHEYFGVDLSIVWEIVSKNLPETKTKIVALLENLDTER